MPEDSNQQPVAGIQIHAVFYFFNTPGVPIVDTCSCERDF